MSDDWRVELDIEDRDVLHRVLDRMRERGVTREARHRLGDAIAISANADKIFAYAPTRDDARHAGSVLAELADAHHLAAHATIARWNHDEERWEPDDSA